MSFAYTFLQFIFTKVLQIQIFVVPLYCSEGGKAESPTYLTDTCTKWLATSDLWSYATNVATW